ncbi:MAG: glycoside hydrolase family 99-like domain-containing protein [Alistipes indistinctus]
MKARIIAFYLPQYHPIPENDAWWGKGFTEWTNVGKAKPLYRGHYQPRVPADLGYYDLRVPETRQAQADMARSYGVEGFMYWHYWFGGGKRLLERPFNEVLASGEPDFPFALAWANETWKGFAHGLTNRNTLIEQRYLGEQDYIDHFHAVLPAFRDRRYITVDGKPLFMVYKPLQHPDMQAFVELWQRLARENGLPGIYFVGQADVGQEQKILRLGMDAACIFRMMECVNRRPFFKKAVQRIKINLFKHPRVFRYAEAARWFVGPEDARDDIIPTIYSGWDHTLRSGCEGTVFSHYTPDVFERHVEQVLRAVENKPASLKIVFVKSWNEWGEGNYMEPDRRYGLQFLERLKKCVE